MCFNMMMTSDLKTKTVLEAQGLTLGYSSTRPPTVIAENIHLRLRRGELVALLGPNGAGKTTLLRTLAGMQPPLAGEIRIEGDAIQDMRPRQLAQRLSIVLTDRLPLEMMTGYELVALGRHPYTDWSGTLRREDHERIEWAIEAVGAGSLAAHLMNELSDGQRQKLMIARALAQDTPVLLLDEPTAFLDLPRRVELMRLLRDCAREFQRAVLLSTHDLDLALRTADRLLLFSEAGTLYDGAPEDLLLSGAFARIFLDEGIEGVEFDAASGTFQLTQPSRGVIALHAPDTADVPDDSLHLKAAWTRRALERAGYTITGISQAGRTQPDRCTIHLTADTWQLHTLAHSDQDAVITCTSLYDLLHAIALHCKAQG